MGNWNLDTSVTITAEIAFATGPLATPTWTDVTAYLDKEWSTFRGKEGEFDDIQPGTLDINFDNSLRTFDPENTAGPYFGNLKPMKKIRLRVALGAFSATIWSGYILGFPQEWGVFKSVASLHCVDGSRIDTKLASSAYAQEVLEQSPIEYATFQGGDLTAKVGTNFVANDSAQVTSVNLGYPVGETDGLEITTTSNSAASARVTLGSLPNALELWAVVATSTSYFFVGVEINSTTYMYFLIGPTVSVSYSDAATTRSVTPFTAIGDVAAGLHHFAFRRNGTNLEMIVDGTLTGTLATTAATTSAGSQGSVGYLVFRNNTVAAASGVSHFAAYSTAPTVADFLRHWNAGRWAWSGPHGDYGWEYGGARINRALDDIGWPSADRDIQPGGTLQAPYYPDGRRAMDYIKEVETSETPGIVFFSVDGKLTFRDRQWLWSRTPSLTFNDTGTGIEYTSSDPRGNDITTIRNVVTVTYARVGAITNRDEASIADYGEQPIDGETLDAPTMGLAQDASNLGRFRVRTRAQPGTVFPDLSAELVPNAATQLPALLGLELGDVVQLTRTPMSQGSAITKKAMVLGIRHRVTAFGWTVELYLSPPVVTAADAPYLTLGDATRGKVGAAFGNIVPF